MVLDSDNINSKKKYNIKIIKADNIKKSLYSPHCEPVDKMKNAYSKNNIREIIEELDKNEWIEPISKVINVKGKKYIDFPDELNNIQECTEINLLETEDELKKLIKELAIMGGIYEK